MAEHVNGKWLLLIHQIPPKPGYLRVKIWRRLQSLGAVAIKNSVYAIPRNDQTLEDFQWVLREIIQSGAEASVCAATFIEGLTDEQVEQLFQRARESDFVQIINDAKQILDSGSSIKSITHEDIAVMEGLLVRLKKRHLAVSRIDFFGAPGADESLKLLNRIDELVSERRLASASENRRLDSYDLKGFQDRTWVTRKGVYIDRMASAWLIKHFIDPRASFRFVTERTYRSRENEIRFDMFNGEFTHEGDKCTFEVLSERFSIKDRAIAELAKIIHDIDLKVTPYRQIESPGILALIDGMVASEKSDELRLVRSANLFNDLYEYFRRT
jgi:hypothetical protein